MEDKCGDHEDPMCSAVCSACGFRQETTKVRRWIVQ